MTNGGKRYSPNGPSDNYYKIEKSANGQFKSGDVVNMELDSVKGTLTFIINDKKTTFEQIPRNKEYKLAITLLTLGGIKYACDVTLISSSTL